MTELPDPIVRHKTNLQKRLLNWFANNRRDFPWRNTDVPFKVLLAEKLLQQTKARDTAVSVYTKILNQYPTIQSLAAADERDLRLLIQPLGLTYRAREIKKMATEIVEVHGGHVPANLKDLLQLTGIGDYCARAVLSFAYCQKIPVVDTNVARFLHRLCGITAPLPANPARKKYLRELAKQLLPEDEFRDFNLAILDLCALVCKSRDPICTECPIEELCVSRVPPQ